MSAVEIRPLHLDDCDKIRPLLCEFWLDEYHGIQTREELHAQSYKVHTPELIEEEIDDPNIHSIVAVKDGRIVGYARSDLKNDSVDIFRIYVLREFYRQGIGSVMFREVDSYFDPKFEV